MGGIGTIGKILRGYGSAVFCGTECEVFSQSIYKNLFRNIRKEKGIFGIEYMPFKGYRNADWKNFGKHMKTAYTDMDNATLAKIGPNGSFLGNIWKEFTDIPACFKNHIKDGWVKAGANGKSKLFGGIKGFGKAFLQKMPLIGSVMFLIGYVPNIIAAFKEGGIGAGLWETAKSFLKIGLDMGGFVIGQALIPIPLVGGLIGSMVLGGIGNAILGKGYKEKNAAKQNNATQNMIDSDIKKRNQEQTQTYMSYNWQPPKMDNIMSEQEYAYAMNQLYGADNSLHRYAWTI